MDDITPLVEQATALHEWFAALQEAGFKEEQALSLIARFLAEGARGSAS